MLLNLPPELIQLVLQNANTPTYLQASLSCRTLYEIASNCREVVLHHLYQTPGLNPDVGLSETKQLFRILMERSSKQLYGAQFRANCKTFRFETEAIEVRASSLALSGDLKLVLVVRGQPKVHLFHIDDQEISYNGTLKSPWTHTGAVEVLKTTFDGDGGIYTLQRFRPTIDEDDPAAEHPFVKHALQSSPSGMIYLVHHEPKNPHGRVRMCAFPDHVDYEPLAFAVADQGTFAVSWQHVRESSENEIILYTLLPESSEDASGIVELSYDSRVLLNQNDQRVDNGESLQARLSNSHFHYDKGPITDLTFNDRSSQLLYHYRAQALYGSFQRLNTSSFSTKPKFHENSCMVQFSDSLSLLFSIAIPFFGNHETCLHNGHRMCHWQYLTLGIATHREENWTVACLLKSEALCRARNCGHVLNLERGRRFSDWKIVARLWGFQDPVNSLGSLVAFSNRGTRIAVANWNVIYVWALEPEALIEENANGFYPLNFRSSSSGMIELRPIVLQVGAVCFKLRFMNGEDKLVVITDRGVMSWDLGPLGKGERTIHQLAI
ncbi:hypothetical protein AWENTII_002562 [Aspergillus wentii]|nr:hypothetical protein MW887_007861 [Aspergillus wentii]